MTKRSSAIDSLGTRSKYARRRLRRRIAVTEPGPFRDREQHEAAYRNSPETVK